MRVSIQTKFLVVSTVLVLLTVAGLSVTYYLVIKRIMHRESQERIRIAFDIILTDFADRLETFTQRVEEFLTQNSTLGLTTSSYQDDPAQVSSVSFLTNYLKEASDMVKRFGQNIAVDCLGLYGADRRLLVVYKREEEQGSIGVYMVSEAGEDTYLPMDDFAQISPILFGESPIPQNPLPSGVSAYYDGKIPETITTQMFSEGHRLGFQVIAPVYHREERVGVLVSSLFYTQKIIDHYASLSKTEINLFGLDHLSVGTLQTQPAFSQQALYAMIPCRSIMEQSEVLPISSEEIDGHDYYQGQCAYRADEELIGAIAVNLSQEVEKQEIRRVLMIVLGLAVVALGGAFGFSWLLSHKLHRSVHNVMSVIGAVAEGDLRSTAVVMTQDEFGILAMRLNRMISRLREIVDQVQEAGVQVSASSAELSATTKQQDTIMGHQLESINSVVQSVQDISEVTANLVETMQRVATMSQEAAGFASSGQSDLFRMEEAMRRMEDASTGISDKLETINEKAENITTMATTINKVSEQTNLLSLNASIEAEKAGEYGRGFSVVAREIRRLADQTAVSTLDIERMVQEMQSAVSSGIMEMDKFVSEVQRSAEDVAKISMQLTLIIDQVQALSPNFDEVKRAMSNQSENAQQINRAVVQVSEEMRQIKKSLHETYTSIAQLNETAQGLHDEVSHFQVK